MALSSVGKKELAERSALECGEGKRGIEDKVLVFGMNI